MDFPNAYRIAEEHPVAPGATFRVTHLERTDRSTTAVCTVQAGGGLRPHIHHHHDEVIFFLEGSAEFRFGDEIRRVSKGDVVVVPAGTAHATQNAETEVLIAAVFAPNFDPHNEDREYVD